MAISPVRLNHAVLFVADLDRSVRFYTDVFGMEVIAREPRANAAFLRLPRSGNHHDLGLFGVGTAGGPKRRGAIGLYHLAWQLDTIDELAAARQALLDAGAYTGESSHGATKSVYGADPDGNEFELMWMLPRDEWGPYENAAPIDHLDLAGEVRRWSGVRTAGQVAPDGAEAHAVTSPSPSTLSVRSDDRPTRELTGLQPPIRIERVVHREPFDVRSDLPGAIHGGDVVEVLDRAPVRVRDRRLVRRREEVPLRGPTGDADDGQSSALGHRRLSGLDRGRCADDVERSIDAPPAGQLADGLDLVVAAGHRDRSVLLGTLHRVRLSCPSRSPSRP